jgi:hypothetical protein
MAYQDGVQTYQRIRAVILRDAWLIDHDHREDEREDGVEEEASDAACLNGARWQFVPPTAEQSGRSHQSDNQGRGSGSGHTDAPLGKKAEADVSPRGVGTLRVDIQAGDPLSSLFHEQKREQEEARRAQKAQRYKRCRQGTT